MNKIIKALLISSFALALFAKANNYNSYKTSEDLDTKKPELYNEDTFSFLTHDYLFLNIPSDSDSIRKDGVINAFYYNEDLDSL